jgi:hypothetical protein
MLGFFAIECKKQLSRMEKNMFALCLGQMPSVAKNPLPHRVAF